MGSTLAGMSVMMGIQSMEMDAHRNAKLSSVIVVCILVHKALNALQFAEMVSLSHRKLVMMETSKLQMVAHPPVNWNQVGNVGNSAL